MQIMREIWSQRYTFSLFLKAKSTLRRRKIEFRGVAKYADAFQLPPSTISNKNVYSIGSTEPNSSGYDSRFEAREKSVDVNVAAGLTKTTVKARKSKMYVLYVED